MNSFDYFQSWAISNGYKDNLTIERKDVNGDYCPENCCWIENKEQVWNKTTTVRVNINGKQIVGLKRLRGRVKLYNGYLSNLWKRTETRRKI